MERFPRGTLPPSGFAAIATIAPHAITKASVEAAVPIAEAGAVVGHASRASCDLSTTCPNCATQMLPEHAHYKCPACGYRDSCCF